MQLLLFVLFCIVTSLSVQVTDGIYEELDSHDEKLNLGITLTPAMPSDLIASYSTISLPVTSSSSKLIKQEDGTSEENVEVGFELWCYILYIMHVVTTFTFN
jgi:hypothetical protein